MKYSIRQEFKEGGNSELSTNYKMILDNYFYGEENDEEMESYQIVSKVTYDYLSSGGYAKSICNSMDKGKIKSCKVNEDNSVEIVAELKPGSFYEYEEEFDWLNLRKIMHYKIKKIPLINYYTKTGMVNTGKEMKQFFLNHLSDYLNESVYCSSSEYFEPHFRCKASQENNKNLFHISWFTTNERFPLKRIIGYYCSDEADLFVDESKIIPLNVSLQQEEIYLECPEEKKILMLEYEEDYYGELSNTSVAFTLKTRDDLKNEILESLPDEEDYSNPDQSGYKETLYFWNFEDGTFTGMEYNSIQNDYYGQASMFKADYTPSFDGKIISARIGNKEIETEENSFTLHLTNMAKYPNAAIEVDVVKELFPIEEYVWTLGVILIVIFAGFAYKNYKLKK